jgi:hypothetical protein
MAMDIPQSLLQNAVHYQFNLVRASAQFWINLKLQTNTSTLTESRRVPGER